jgi:hypothetical protein
LDRKLEDKIIVNNMDYNLKKIVFNEKYIYFLLQTVMFIVDLNYKLIERLELVFLC